MASSFVSQVPSIVNLIAAIRPASILDIGKGFGKYGFLLHEYIGINNQRKLDPTRKMKEQSELIIDAVEVDPDLMLPHLEHFYNKIYFGDVLKLYPELPRYEMIMMIDIIEHINKEETIPMLKHFLSLGSNILISTPIDFFEQHLYDSEYENHVSHWTIKDFSRIGLVEVQYYADGAVYFLSRERRELRSFGNSLSKKLKRIVRAVRNEI